VIATFWGRPTTLEGALTSPTTFGGENPKSIIVTVSSPGLAWTVIAPFTSTDLLSFAVGPADPAGKPMREARA
jgi:hypothetical protein